VVSKDGVEPDPGKVDTLTGWLKIPPRSVYDLQTFIGAAGYYRCFIERFSKIARPLHSLVTQATKKPGRRKPSAPVDKGVLTAFELLINKLVSAPVLPYPNFKLPFILHTDASAEAERRYSAYCRGFLAFK